MLRIHEKKVFYPFIGLMIFLLVVIISVTYPNAKRIIEINQKITKLRNELELKYEKSRRLNRSMEKLKEAQRIVEVNQQIYVNRGEEIGLIDQLENLAKELALRQEVNLDSGENPVNAAVHFLNLDVRLNGQLKNLMTYLNKVEQMKVIIGLTDLHLVNEDSLASLAIKGRVYVKK